MKDKEILNIYKQMVPFLASICGPSSEVVLHDLSDVNKSIISIENSKSGRTVGSSITDFAQKIINNGDFKHCDFLSNYHGATKDNKFVSNTFFVKNNGRLIGLLCVNKDISALTVLEKALDQMKLQYNIYMPESSVQEVLDIPVAAMLENMVANAVAETGLSPEHMCVNDKKQIIHKLHQQGVLSMKGAVAEISNQLQISKSTVYRILRAQRNA